MALYGQAAAGNYRRYADRASFDVSYITVSIWVKFPSIIANTSIVCRELDGNTNGYWVLGLNPTTSERVWSVRIGTSWVTVVGAQAPVAGVWEHWVGLVNSSNSDAFLYLNGAQYGTAAGTGTMSAGTDSVNLFEQSGGLGHCDVIVSQLGIWNSDLNLSEIARLYSGCPPHLVRPEALILADELTKRSVDLVGFGAPTDGGNLQDMPRVFPYRPGYLKPPPSWSNPRSTRPHRRVGAPLQTLTITNDRSSSYTVLQTKTNDRATSYAVSKSITSDQAAAYYATLKTTRDLAGAYFATSQRTYNEVAQYLVSTKVASSKQAAYFASIKHIQDLNTQYAVLYKTIIAGDRAGAYKLNLTNTSNKQAGYQIIEQQLKALASSYNILYQRIISGNLSASYNLRYLGACTQAAGYSTLRGSLYTLSAAYELNIFALYPGSSTLPTAGVRIDNLETAPVGAVDLWMKGPFSLYITIDGELKKLPDSIRNKLLANNIVYTWRYAGQTGKFLYRQSLPAPKLIETTGEVV